MAASGCSMPQAQQFGGRQAIATNRTLRRSAQRRSCRLSKLWLCPVTPLGPGPGRPLRHVLLLLLLLARVAGIRRRRGRRGQRRGRKRPPSHRGWAALPVRNPVEAGAPGSRGGRPRRSWCVEAAAACRSCRQRRRQRRRHVLRTPRATDAVQLPSSSMARPDGCAQGWRTSSSGQVKCHVAAQQPGRPQTGCAIPAWPRSA